QSPQEAAQLAVRIQQLEEQVRLLTGQVEGVQFQLTQLQTLIEKQTADNEFRFQQLEGGAPPPPNSGPIGDDRLPADPTTTAALPEAPVELGTGEPMDDLPLPEEMADSAYPLVGTNSMGTGVLGGEPGDIALGGSRP